MVVEAVVVGGTAEVVVVVVVVEVVGVLGTSDISGTGEAVAEVVGVLGVSDASDGTEEATVVVVEEVAVLAVAAGAVSASDADGKLRSPTTLPTASVIVVAVPVGAEVTEVATASVAAVVSAGLLSPPPEEQAEPTNPKTAATATARTHFVFLITESLSSENSGFIFYHTSIEPYSDASLSGRA